MVNNHIINEIEKIKNSELSKKVNQRLNEFSSFKNKSTKEWFSELCFCLLTANSKAKTAINIQNELKADGFINLSQEEIKNCIIKNKHRFHNNKSKFIVNAREHVDIKTKIIEIINKKNEMGARQWLVDNIKGIGYKEASHFLRNVGYFNLAILDRHILNLMAEHNYIQRPKHLNKSTYLEIEEKFNFIAEKAHMAPAELDLYMWYMKTGEILK